MCGLGTTRPVQNPERLNPERPPGLEVQIRAPGLTVMAIPNNNCLSHSLRTGSSPRGAPMGWGVGGGSQGMEGSTDSGGQDIR